MALKDWKLIKFGSNHKVWNNKYSESIIAINREILETKKGKYNFSHVRGDGKLIIKKYFKTKSQALAFAKAYMRKN